MSTLAQILTYLTLLTSLFIIHLSAEGTINAETDPTISSEDSGSISDSKTIGRENSDSTMQTESQAGQETNSLKDDDSEAFPKHIVPRDVSEPSLKYSLFIFRGGLANEPKPEKRATGGEDALFYSPHLLSVADGVGGWALQGIDSSKYSRRLVELGKELFYKNPEHYSEHPRDLLIKAARGNFELGSSTLIFCTMWDKVLKVGFIGDSGYLLFKPELKQIHNQQAVNIIYTIDVVSDEQEHAFNFPFQIGGPESKPEIESVAFEHEVGYGHILVVMSDGVLDNLFPHDVQHLLNMYIEELKQIHGRMIFNFIEEFDGKEFSERLAKKSFEVSLDESRVSPFAVGALNSGMISEGGKSDDISVVTAVIDLSEPIKTQFVSDFIRLILDLVSDWIIY